MWCGDLRFARLSMSCGSPGRHAHGMAPSRRRGTSVAQPAPEGTGGRHTHTPGPEVAALIAATAEAWADTAASTAAPWPPASGEAGGTNCGGGGKDRRFRKKCQIENKERMGEKEEGEVGGVRGDAH